MKGVEGPPKSLMTQIKELLARESGSPITYKKELKFGVGRFIKAKVLSSKK